MHSKLTASVAAVALFCATGGAAQQCALDLNGDRMTTVNELIVAVNQALSGCPGGPVATPTRTPIPAGGCPFDFNHNNSRSGDDFCAYFGPTSGMPGCGVSTSVSGGWFGNGATITGLITNGTTSFALTATKTSATSARVTTVALGPDFDNPVAATGTLSLPSSRRFTESFDSGVRCASLGFDGTFTAVIHATAAGLGVAGHLAVAAGAMGVAPDAPVDLGGLAARYRARSEK